MRGATAMGTNLVWKGWAWVHRGMDTGTAARQMSGIAAQQEAGMGGGESAFIGMHEAHDEA